MSVWNQINGANTTHCAEFTRDPSSCRHIEAHGEAFANPELHLEDPTTVGRPHAVSSYALAAEARHHRLAFRRRGCFCASLHSDVLQYSWSEFAATTKHQVASRMHSSSIAMTVVAKHTLRVVAKHTLRVVKKQHAVQCHIPETLRLQTRASHRNRRRIDMRAIRRHIVGQTGVASWAWRNCHSKVLCAAYALAHNSLQVLAVGVVRAQVLAQCQAVYTPTLQRERV